MFVNKYLKLIIPFRRILWLLWSLNLFDMLLNRLSFAIFFVIKIHFRINITWISVVALIQTIRYDFNRQLKVLLVYILAYLFACTYISYENIW